ncbi:hypothetical protein MCOR02_001914 [Pyricularia oryzae]|nr:hypothetical protein MCOR02_001914 [Pyricularia oryzae]KAI6259384.1 hypothetical protein MCOR19_004305 [Pyricularia oryzae]KAI6319649.1 hypothetical protein MCOR34_003195 [Pyricularia oryzae]KAI6430259.1 hypothetical protein MCOR21_004656 [Pyricularia oryzae]KAI6454033.1 hypothetical protein MCOR15_008404 [Pyricularia oryzae]
MPSYVITGASRGIGWALLENVSRSQDNKVVGLVRDKATVDKRVAQELKDRSNITIIQADLIDYDALERAAKQTAELTGGGLDYLIANGALMTFTDAYDVENFVKYNGAEGAAKYLRDSLETNVVGNFNLYSLFTPLILKGDTKRVLSVSSGHADLSLVSQYHLEACVAYAASKAAHNMITGKFHARYARDGVLFISVCPGTVDTLDFSNLNEGQQAAMGQMQAIFKEFQPEWDGPKPASESAVELLRILDESTIEAKGGQYFSHTGTDKWL